MTTEADWRTEPDPRKLLAQDGLSLRFSGRKLRLVALALAREVRHLIHTDEVLKGFDLAEYVADLPDDHEEEGPVNSLLALRQFQTTGPRAEEQARMAFCEAVGLPTDAADNPYEYLTATSCWESPGKVAKLAALAAASAAAGPAPVGLSPSAPWHRLFNATWAEVLVRQAAVTRCVLGNPFQLPLPFDPNWRTEPVRLLARQAYDSREFGTLPFLADAVEEAGCDDAELLAHLRGDGPHARGCWAVDVILGKG